MCNPIPRERAANTVRWLAHAHTHTHARTAAGTLRCVPNTPDRHPPPRRALARVPNLSAYNEHSTLRSEFSLSLSGRVCVHFCPVPVPVPAALYLVFACATYKFTHCPTGTVGPMRTSACARGAHSSSSPAWHRTEAPARLRVRPFRAGHELSGGESIHRGWCV